MTKREARRRPEPQAGESLLEWAREELNLRPHAYQASTARPSDAVSATAVAAIVDSQGLARLSRIPSSTVVRARQPAPALFMALFLAVLGLSLLLVGTTAIGATPIGGDRDRTTAIAATTLDECLKGNPLAQTTIPAFQCRWAL